MTIRPGEVAQAHLARGLLGGLEVGLERGVLDRGLAGGAARVHVDGDQRLGNVDDDVAAGLELHGRVEHRAEVALDLEAREQRQGLIVVLHVLRVRRHEHLHVVLGLAVTALAVNQDLVDIAAVEVADHPLDQRAFLVDRRRRDRLQGEVADLLPLAEQVFVVALDLGLGAVRAGGADDQAGALGHHDRGGDLLELLAVGDVGDLAADAAAACGVGHQHAVAAGEAEVGRERGALVAALLLHDLHQHDLAHLHHFLDLVAALAGFAGRALLGDVVAADALVVGPGVARLLIARLLVGGGVLGWFVVNDDVDLAGCGAGRRRVVVVGVEDRHRVRRNAGLRILGVHGPGRDRRIRGGGRLRGPAAAAAARLGP